MKSKLWKLLAIFAVLGLVAVGCGDDDDSASSSASESSSSESSSSEASSSSSEASSSEAAEEECELARGVTEDKILFGSSQPLTGNLDALGEQAVLAMEVTRDRINEGGGINGRMIEFIVQDDAYNPEKTVANAQYFIEQENVFAIWASIGSATLKAALPLHDESNTPSLFPWAQDLSFYDVNNHPLFFSVNPPAYAQTKGFGNYLVENFGTDGIKVGLMTINSVDGEQTVQGYKDSSGGDLLVDEQTWERDSTTYGPQILSFIDSGVTDVYVGTGDTQFAQFLLEADQLGLDARFWGSTGTISANTIELAGDLSEGAYGVNVISSATGDKPGLNAYREAMLAAGAEEAQISTASLLAYTGGLVLEEMLTRAGECLTVESFVAAGESIKDFDTGGIMRPLNFSAENHLGNNDVIILQVQNGAWEELVVGQE